MRSSYSQRVRDSILPFSVADSLPKAFEEWFFTEETVDCGEPVETCQLCQHESIRYQFEIKNNLTKKTLWVGSKCILKFNLSVFEGGTRLTCDEARKKLNRLTEQMLLESCIKALDRLAKTESNDILTKALTFYREKKYLTPRLAFVVFWRLRTHNIDHSPSFFKISLKKILYKEDLRHMATSRVQMIWPALSSAQRKQAIEMGHKAPPAT
jgi:hypothetical protein